MSTATYGAGRAPAGSARCGFGSPATSDAPGVAAIGEARAIDPLSRDYTFDADTGQLERMSGAAQSVYIAVATRLDRSAVAGLGLSAMPDRKRASMRAEVSDSVRAALAHIDTIEIVSIEFTKPAHATREVCRVTWRDVATQEETATDV